MPRPLLPPRGIFVPTKMIYNCEIPPKIIFTWIQLRGLAWDRTETPQLSMAQLSDLTGKSQSTLYAHIARLRFWGALRMRPSVKGSIIVTFPADTGEFSLNDDSSPVRISDRFNAACQKGDSEFSENDSENLEIPDSRNLEKPDLSPSSSNYYLDSEPEEKREGDSPPKGEKINNLDLSRGGNHGDSENLETFSENLEKNSENSENLSPPVGDLSPFTESNSCQTEDEPVNFMDTISSVGDPRIEGMEASLNQSIPPQLDGADPVKIYQTITGIRPNKSQREHLKDLVYDTNLWYLSVEHWQSHGWNPKNIAGILQVYQRGGPSACRYCHQEEDSDSLSAIKNLRKDLKETSDGD